MAFACGRLCWLASMPLPAGTRLSEGRALLQIWRVSASRFPRTLSGGERIIAPGGENSPNFPERMSRRLDLSTLPDIVTVQDGHSSSLPCRNGVGQLQIHFNFILARPRFHPAGIQFRCRCRLTWSVKGRALLDVGMTRKNGNGSITAMPVVHEGSRSPARLQKWRRNARKRRYRSMDFGRAIGSSQFRPDREL